MIQNLLAALTLLLVFPLGFLLAWLCKEELKQGRAYFKIMIGLCLLAAVVISFINFQEKLAVILSLFFVIILASVSLYKSYEKK